MAEPRRRTRLEREFPRSYFEDRVNAMLRSFGGSNVNRGLTTRRVDRFERFVLDESTVDRKCLVCQDDPTIGTRMIGLPCGPRFL